MHAIHTVRAYELARGKAPSTGSTVLVDAMWPRGIRKTDLKLDEWCKAVAPSKGLRQWFSHDVSKWTEFKRRYQEELDGNEEAWRPLLATAQRGPLTLVYSAKGEAHNNAVVLRGYLQRKLEEAGGGGGGATAAAAGRAGKKPARKEGEPAGHRAKRSRRAEE